MKVQSAVTGAILGIAVALAVGNAEAAVLWDNGPPFESGAVYCSNNGTGCGSDNTGFTVYDDFRLDAAAKITGFTYHSGFPIGADQYLSTNWSIWTTDPVTSWAGGPALSGIADGINSAASFGFTLTTITGLSIELSPGTYWLGIQNNVISGPVHSVESTLAFLGKASQIANNGTIFNPTIPDRAFTVEGELSEVPIPPALLLFATGLGAMGVLARRRKKQAA